MRKTKQNSNMFPIIMIAGGVVVIFAILIWQLVSQSPTAAVTQPANGNTQRVSLAEAKTALENKTAVMVDVRDLDVYNISHITGAVNMPLGELESRFGELDPKRWIITYCT